MKIGLFSALFADRPLESILDDLQKMGFSAIELFAGARAPATHCDIQRLLKDPEALRAFRESLARRNLQISALNASGNPVSPDPEMAKKHRDAFEYAVRLAEKLGLDTVVVFSGCPGGAPGDKTPNWVTCPWPEEYSRALAYQWDEVLIPYWEKAAAFAADHGVSRLAFEMHPGFCVYNPQTLLKLRAAVGPAIGANFDPSHLFWQGIKADRAILALKEAVFHVHAKDTRIFEDRVAQNGVLDARHYSLGRERPWVFGTVGYGQPEQVWRGIIDALAFIGYDGVISIEHEDMLMNREEGLEKAFRFLSSLLIKNKPDAMWWA